MSEALANSSQSCPSLSCLSKFLVLIDSSDHQKCPGWQTFPDHFSTVIEGARKHHIQNGRPLRRPTGPPPKNTSRWLGLQHQQAVLTANSRGASPSQLRSCTPLVVSTCLQHFRATGQSTTFYLSLICSRLPSMLRAIGLWLAPELNQVILLTVDDAQSA